MNSTKITLETFAFFVGMFLFIGIVYAQDYSLFSGNILSFNQTTEKIEFNSFNDTYYICENDRRIIPMLVVNKEKNVDNSFDLDIVGASWTNLNAKRFSLPRQKSGVVLLELFPGKNSKGEYDVIVAFQSSVGNIKKGLNLKINVEKCYDFDLNLEKEYDILCGGTKKIYNGKITNHGKQRNIFDLSVNGPDWIEIDKNKIILNSNSTDKFELIVDVPKDVIGIFNIIVSSRIHGLSNIFSEKNLMLEIVPKFDCYKADFLAKSRIVNYYSNEYVPIKIKNTGIKRAAYNITLEAPKWIVAEPSILIINPGQAAPLNLHINPSSDVNEGTYALNLIAQFEDIVYSKDINIVVKMKNQFLKNMNTFFVFYQYYIYVVSVVLIILFVFRKKISNSIRTRLKKYKVRKAKLKALKAARKAKEAKKKLLKL